MGDEWLVAKRREGVTRRHGRQARTGIQHHAAVDELAQAAALAAAGSVMLMAIVLNGAIVIRMGCRPAMMVHAIMAVRRRSVRPFVSMRWRHATRHGRGERGTRLHGQPERNEDEKQLAQHLVGPVGRFDEGYRNLSAKRTDREIFN